MSIRLIYQYPPTYLFTVTVVAFCSFAGQNDIPGSLVKFDVTSIVLFTSFNYLPNKTLAKCIQFCQQESSSTAFIMMGYRYILAPGKCPLSLDLF